MLGTCAVPRMLEGNSAVDVEKYTERSKGFLQSAQSLALRSGHQRLTPEHLLKVLLEDPEGLCANLIRAAGGDPKAALAATDAELDKLPKVEGSGAGQVYMAPELARISSGRPKEREETRTGRAERRSRDRLRRSVSTEAQARGGSRRADERRDTAHSRCCRRQQVATLDRDSSIHGHARERVASAVLASCRF